MGKAPQDKPAGQMAPAQSVGGQRTAVRRRVTATSGGAQPTKPPRPAAAASAGILKFYTDDAPGLKVGPQTVLVLTLVFMVLVVTMHVIGKFRQSVSNE